MTFLLLVVNITDLTGFYLGAIWSCLRAQLQPIMSWEIMDHYIHHNTKGKTKEIFLSLTSEHRGLYLANIVIDFILPFCFGC